ncbi:MAG: lipoyl synthase [Thermodesulfobacteriota bacterium]
MPDQPRPRPSPKPAWLRRPLAPAAGRLRASLKGLHTVCQEAHCPNRAECHARGEAAFLLLGPACTRACAFCAVDKSAPAPPDPGEADRVAAAVRDLGLGYCVLTMVSRDDLADGGAGAMAAAIRAVRRENPGIQVEALVSDLGGDAAALATVLAAGPAVLNHNLETAPRLYAAVRPQADYDRSLTLLARARRLAPHLPTKSGLMLGLGEETAEVIAVMDDLLAAGVGILTLGQYLAPSPAHHPVARYLPPEEFEALGREARRRGFAGVASAPLVRSSHQAGALFAGLAGAPAD